MSLAHVIHQSDVIGSTLRLLVARSGETPALPGPWIPGQVPVRAPDMVAGFIAFSGGGGPDWAGELPPGLFPQWAWPTLTRTLHGLPYPLTKVVNAGCSWTRNGKLPADAPLLVRARLSKVEDDGRKALISIQVQTGTANQPELLDSVVTMYVPLPRDPKAPKSPRKEPLCVPEGARELTTRPLGARAGWEFATLTGDFNPIHWVRLSGKLAGFGGTILHGFGSAAIASQALCNDLGGTDALEHFECRFTRPVKLPTTVSVFVQDDQVFVGTAPGEPAMAVGAFRARQ
jgi:acyl dehydratase